MRSISWIKHPAIILFAAAIAAGCGSDSKNSTSTPVAACVGASNNKIDTGEDCDGTDLGGKTCTSMGLGMFKSGKLACKADCTFDTSKCSTSAGTGGTSGSGGTGTGGGPTQTGGGPNGGSGNKDGGADGGKDSGPNGSGGTSGTDAGKDSSTPPVDSGKD